MGTIWNLHFFETFLVKLSLFLKKKITRQIGFKSSFSFLDFFFSLVSHFNTFTTVFLFFEKYLNIKNVQPQISIKNDAEINFFQTQRFLTIHITQTKDGLQCGIEPIRLFQTSNVCVNRIILHVPIPSKYLAAPKSKSISCGWPVTGWWPKKKFDQFGSVCMNRQRNTSTFIQTKFSIKKKIFQIELQKNYFQKVRLRVPHPECEVGIYSYVKDSQVF